MLKEPDFDEPLIEGKSYVCLDKGQYHAYLDLTAAHILLHGLHWFYDQQPGEEIDIRSNWNDAPQRGERIGYCEFNLAPAHSQKKQGKNILKDAQPTMRYKPHGVYSPENGRLDYFVSPHEVQTAYETLTLLVQNSEVRRSLQTTTIFGTLVIHLVLP